MPASDFAFHYRIAEVIRPLAAIADGYDRDNTYRPDRADDEIIAQQGDAVLTLGDAFRAQRLLKELLEY